MRSCGRGRGGCWPPRWRRRWPPTIAAHAAGRDENGRRLVVRNGHARPRQVTTAAGGVEDRRADPATGERARFRSSILPPWCRKGRKITEVLPLLYLHGLSATGFVPALEHFPGSGAGLPAPAVTRLTEAWQEEYRRWWDRGLSGAGYVYCWAGGLHFGVRLDADRVCTLVVVGVRAGGKKELAALAGGRASPPGRGPGCCAMPAAAACAPRCWPLGTALGFWAARREVFPKPRQGRCRVHKVVNALDCLPKTGPARRP